jgi:hypothetical protein
MNLALGDSKAHMVQSLYAGKFLGDVLHFEYRSILFLLAPAHLTFERACHQAAQEETTEQDINEQRW